MAKEVLVSRMFSNFVCGFGILQLFFATGLAVCGFVTLGIFKNISSVGIWAGLPMMVPAILCVVFLGTRHRMVSLVVFITGVVVLAVSSYHAYYVYDRIDFWEDYRKSAVEINSLGVKTCYNRGDHCICNNAARYQDSGYIVQFCDQFRIGEELFWAMFVLTLAGIFFTLITTVLAMVSLVSCTAEESNEPTDQKRPYAVDVESKNNYAYSN